MADLRDPRSRLALSIAALGALVLVALTFAFRSCKDVRIVAEPPRAADAPSAAESTPLEAPVLEQTAERTDAAHRVASDESTPTRVGLAGRLHVHVDGRIVGPSDEPLSGALMDALDLPGVAAAISDSDGRIDWAIEFAADAAAAKAGVASALVSRAGFASTVCKLMLLPDPDCHLGTIRLQPGAAIVGLVRDRSGRAVFDAEICPVLELPSTDRSQQLDHARTRSGSDGSFRLDGLPLGSIGLGVQARRMSTLYVPHIELARAGEVVEVQVTLEELAREKWSEGKVFDPHGRPFAGATLQMNLAGIRAGWTSSEKSDATGAISLKPGKLTPNQLVCAVDPTGRFDPSEAQPVAPGARGLEFRLREPRYFRARLVNERGEGVPWGWIDLIGEGIQSRAPGYWESTDRSAVARMRVPRERFRARVFAQGYRTQEFGPFEPKDVGDELEFALTAGQAVRGRVIARGFGVPGANVQLCRAFATGEPRVSSDATIGGQMFDLLGHAYAESEATTDAEGRFVLTIHNGGWYWLRARYQERGFASAGPINLQPASASEDVVLELAEPGALRGKVLVAPGRSTDGIVVGVSNGDGAARVRTVGADGTFHFDALPAGGWQVRHCRTGLAPTQRLAPMNILGQLGYVDSQARGTPVRPAPGAMDVVIEPGRTAEFTLDLVEENQCVLVGRFEAEGVAPADCHVGLFDGRSRAWELDTALMSAQLDAKGAFRIEVTAPGRYRLRIRARGMLLYDVVELRPGELRWERALACGSLRAEEVPAQSQLLKLRRALVHEWSGPGDLRVFHGLAGAKDGVVELAHVPEGPGRIAWIRIQDGISARMQSTPVMDTLVRAGEPCRVTLPEMQ